MSRLRLRARALGPALVAAATAGLAPTDAVAAGSDVPMLGNEAAISAGAVLAAGRGVGMAWYNPAALGANDRGRIETSSQAFVLRLHRVDQGAVTDLADGPITSDIRSRALVILPGASVWAFRIGDGVSAAVSLFVPTFDEIDMDARTSGSSAAASYSQQARIQHNHRRYEVGPSIGWEIIPEVRIGASAFVVYDRIARSSRMWARGLDNADRSERFVQTDVSESIRSWGTELVAGVQWTATPRLELGLAVRSGQLWVSQRSDRSGVVTDGGEGPMGGHGDIGFVALGSGISRPRDPLQVDAGIAVRFDRGWVAVDAVAAPGRQGDDDDGRRARWALRAGTRIDVGRRLVLGGGVYLDRSTTVVADDFLDFDLDTYGVTFGGELRRPVRLGRRERSRTIVFTPAVAVRYALSLGSAGRLRVDLTDLDDQDGEVLLTAGAPTDARIHDLTLHIGGGVEF